MVTITINHKHIEKAIEIYDGNAPTSVSCYCPMWQAVNAAGIIDESFKIGASCIELKNSKIHFSPVLPSELYIRSGWETALKHAPYTFQVDL